MNALEVLEKARALIADETRWTQGWFAKNASGFDCGAKVEGAVRWCALGAMSHTIDTRNYDPNATATAYDRLFEAAGSRGILSINDLEGHAATLAMFDRAMAAERAKGAT